MKTTDQQTNKRNMAGQQLADYVQRQLQRLTVRQRKWGLLILGLLMAACCAASILQAVHGHTYWAMPQHFKAPRIAYPPDSALRRGWHRDTNPCTPEPYKNILQDTIKTDTL